ncbi:MAG: hypothetical protein UW75_C0053G0004 [Parcubacteria group bacterium GW2011_GWF2_44_8]|nr:MAG: hypothetical protein UW75_C0053G0004 [Parcubacteria group bacterium GW2011_GWF2_44_8]
MIPEDKLPDKPDAAPEESPTQAEAAELTTFLLSRRLNLLAKPQPLTRNQLPAPHLSWCRSINLLCP